MPHLVVVHGAPLTGKTTLARAIAGAFDAKAALVSADGLLHESIPVHAGDASAELEMVYTQVRLLVANYLKSHYHVVMEGAFFHEIEGVLHRREQEIDRTLGLMRNLAPSPLLVRLDASPETLQERAGRANRLREVEAALRIQDEYRQRYGNRFMELNTDARSVEDLARDVMGQLRGEYF